MTRQQRVELVEKMRFLYRMNPRKYLLRYQGTNLQLFEGFEVFGGYAFCTLLPSMETGPWEPEGGVL